MPELAPHPAVDFEVVDLEVSGDFDRRLGRRLIGRTNGGPVAWRQGSGRSGGHGGTRRWLVVWVAQMQLAAKASGADHKSKRGWFRSEAVPHILV